MKTKKIWANLSVEDVEKTHQFYKALGFRPNGEFPNKYELASFLVGEDDFVVHFFSKESIKPSLGGEIADLKQGNEVMFTLSADSKKEVDKWAKAVKKQAAPFSANPRKFRRIGTDAVLLTRTVINGMCFTTATNRLKKTLFKRA